MTSKAESPNASPILGKMTIDLSFDFRRESRDLVRHLQPAETKALSVLVAGSLFQDSSSGFKEFRLELKP